MTRGKKKNIDAGDPTENSPPPPRVPVSNPPPPPSIPPKKIFIINADMTQQMQWEAFDIAVTVFEKNHHLDTVTAEEIKTEFDRRHGPSWHCIVGSNFGSHVTHEPNHFVNFYLEQKAVLLYKYG